MGSCIFVYYARIIMRCFFFFAYTFYSAIVVAGTVAVALVGGVKQKQEMAHQL